MVDLTACSWIPDLSEIKKTTSSYLRIKLKQKLSALNGLIYIHVWVNLTVLLQKAYSKSIIWPVKNIELVLNFQKISWRYWPASSQLNPFKNNVPKLSDTLKSFKKHLQLVAVALLLTWKNFLCGQTESSGLANNS